jgi:hypothetical protein
LIKSSTSEFWELLDELEEEELLLLFSDSYLASSFTFYFLFYEIFSSGF